MTVLIADDDTGFRESVRDILESEGIRTAEAFDGISTLRVFKRKRVESVLLDLKMPGTDGMQVLAKLRKTAPHVPIIILTGYGDIPTAVAAIKRGAYDFIAKPPDFDELIATVKTALGLRGRWPRNEKGPCPDLTQREREILCLTAEGANCKQIAERLLISYRTVEKYRETLMQKLGVHNKAELVRYAICKST